jgi:hypothetical protein
MDDNKLAGEEVRRANQSELAEAQAEGRGADGNR